MSKTGKKSQNKNSMATFFKVLRFIGKYRFLLVLSVILAAVTVILQLYVPVLFGYAIDEVVAAHEVDFGRMGFYLSRILVMIVLSGIATWVMSIINNRMTYRDQECTYKSYTCIDDVVDTSCGRVGETAVKNSFLAGISKLLVDRSETLRRTVLIAKCLNHFLISNHFLDQCSLTSTGITLCTEHLEGMGGDEFCHKKAHRSQDNDHQCDPHIFGKHEDQSSDDGDDTGKQLCKSKEHTIRKNIRIRNDTADDITGAVSVQVGQRKFLDMADGFRTDILYCAVGHTVVDDVKGAVGIQNVSFRYEEDKPLIEGFNLHTEPGRRIAIVGPTGCGKTTFINLLMRFYDVTGGSISVDGKPITEVSRHALRGSYGMVLQDTWIKHGTVRDNICIGKPDASDEEVIQAAKMSHSWEFIRRLPNGLDTILYEDSLSQGQKQLLCITRIMLCLPPMLILDEATSSIDTRTEMLIQEAFDRMMQGRTSFIPSAMQMRFLS